MNNHALFNKRREQLISEYVSENQNARRGRRNVLYSLWTIFILKAALALFEIPTFIILHKPLNIMAILLVLPLIFVLHIINHGAKGFSYLLLISSTLRLLIYFAAIYKNLPECNLTNAYSFILFGALIAQFFLSLFLLINFDCDTYFSAAQRITIKVQGEFMTAKLKAEAEKAQEISSVDDKKEATV